MELCADLASGGTTPSPGRLTGALEGLTRAALRVMIRPRPGDFSVNAAEEAVMLAGIEAVKAAPNPHGLALGVVFGATAGRVLDTAVLGRLVAASAPLPVTVHKAFDEVDDQFAALDALIGLGVDAVLTSGGAATALEGSARLAALRRRAFDAGNRLQVMAGGGIREHNVARVLAETGVPAIHLRAPMLRDGRELPETTDENLIRRVLAAVAQPGSSGPGSGPEVDGGLLIGDGAGDEAYRGVVGRVGVEQQRRVGGVDRWGNAG